MRALGFFALIFAAPLAHAGSDPAGSSATEDDQVKAAVLAEREAELELAVGGIRLTLLRARTRLAQDRYSTAIELAWRGLEAVEKLPLSVARAPLIDQLEQVIIDARSERGGGPDAGSKASKPLDPTELEAAEAELEAAQKDKPKYFPERKGFTEADARLRDAERLQYEADLRRGYKSDEADLLARSGEDRRIPGRLLAYPDDWAQLSKRREKYRSGIMYEGPPFRGEDGEMRQTVVYDIQSLLFPVPYFHDFPIMDLRVSTREAADRQALRTASEIFTGYARDLAEGLPLLIYFGGIDDLRAIGDVDKRQQDDLMRIIEEVLEAQ
jgi:hypothetical protein